MTNMHLTKNEPYTLKDSHGVIAVTFWMSDAENKFREALNWEKYISFGHTVTVETVLKDWAPLGFTSQVNLVKHEAFVWSFFQKLARENPHQKLFYPETLFSRIQYNRFEACRAIGFLQQLDRVVKHHAIPLAGAHLNTPHDPNYFPNLIPFIEKLALLLAEHFLFNPRVNRESPYFPKACTLARILTSTLRCDGFSAPLLSKCKTICENMPNTAKNPENKPSACPGADTSAIGLASPTFIRGVEAARKASGYNWELEAANKERARNRGF